MCRRAEALQGKKVVLERRLALIRAGVGAALKSLGGRLMPAPRPEDPACVFNTLLQARGDAGAGWSESAAHGGEGTLGSA